MELLNKADKILASGDLWTDVYKLMEQIKTLGPDGERFVPDLVKFVENRPEDAKELCFWFQPLWNSIGPAAEELVRVFLLSFGMTYNLDETDSVHCHLEVVNSAFKKYFQLNPDACRDLLLFWETNVAARHKHDDYAAWNDLKLWLRSIDTGYNMKYHPDQMCAVCGWGLSFEPDAGQSCPCCGIDFFFSHKDHIERYRENWILRGTPWSCQEMKPPEGWNPQDQMKQMPKEYPIWVDQRDYR